MSDAHGFWSYVHKDDTADGGRISRLAKDVVGQYEMLTGETICLFLDKDAIEWGDDWRNKIEENLASVAFFIPVLTPRYFMSPECRSELQFFARRATQLGIKELILPLLYVSVPALDDENTKDDLARIVRTFQREDWRELRFKDPASEDYRSGVARLAARLVEANRRAEQTDITDTGQRLDQGRDESDDDSPGLIDRIAGAEEALPKLSETLHAITEQIKLIGNGLMQAGSDIQNATSQRKVFAQRVVIAKRLARTLSEPNEKVWRLSNDYASQLHDFDVGIRAIIELAPAEIKEHPESKQEVCEFFHGLQELSAATSKGFDEIQHFTDSIAPIEKMSRDLRPVFRRLRQGLTIMIEAREVSDSWVSLIEASGIDCQSDGDSAHT
ncbi:MAG: toll/interleukin-1 receptor domain-containing protein [Planctomycetes bacterium]|nr:toll/interleukin-1 receptor domain-containing protein [Planctomycetota bacterium]